LLQKVAKKTEDSIANGVVSIEGPFKKAGLFRCDVASASLSTRYIRRVGSVHYLRGARISPRTKPAINPHRCAAMLTCGVERSKAT
jgi:hypothetical protein